MLHQTESAADVVIGQINFQVRVGNSKIIKPDHKFQFSSGKCQRRFVVWRSPIVDRPTPGLWPKGTIKNWPGALVQVIQIHDTLGNKVTVEHQQRSTLIEENGESFTGILDHSLVCFFGLVVHGAVVPIFVAGREILLSSFGLTQSRDAIVENTVEVVANSFVNTSQLQTLHGGVVVLLRSDMGASYPSDKVSDGSVEMEERSSHRSDSILVNFGLDVPGRIKSSGRFEWHIPIVGKEIPKKRRRTVGGA